MSPLPYYGRSEMQSEVNIFRKLILPFPGGYDRRESALSIGGVSRTEKDRKYRKEDVFNFRRASHLCSPGISRSLVPSVPF